MITTVTTVTTVTTIAALGLTTVFGAAAVIALMIFLTSRELASTGNSRFSMRLSRFASVGILPLVITFVVIVSVELAKML